MKLWELKEKLNALPIHDDDLDVMLWNEEYGIYKECYKATRVVYGGSTFITLEDTQ